MPDCKEGEEWCRDLERCAASCEGERALSSVAPAEPPPPPLALVLLPPLGGLGAANLSSLEELWAQQVGLGGGGRSMTQKQLSLCTSLHTLATGHITAH